MNGALSIDPWLALAVATFVLAILALTLFARRERMPAASTDAKLNELNTRMAQVEEKQKTTDHDVRNIRMVVGNLPTKDSISQISNQVAESRGKIDGMQIMLGSLGHAVDRIESFLTRAASEAIMSAGRGKTGNGDER